MANLKLTDVAKSYGTVDVLKHIDLDIETGELIVFVGPSGCGKSTLAADDRGAGKDHRRDAGDRRDGGERCAALGAWALRWCSSPMRFIRI